MELRIVEMNKILLIILSLLAVGCSEKDYFEEEIDLNNDGKADVFYEYELNAYYELVDRNFDGEIDESTKYSYDHYIQNAHSDDNFDGIMETKVRYKNGLLSQVLVDSNNNQLIDMIFLFKNDLLIEASKYYIGKNKAKAKIGVVKFEFGYPKSSEKYTITDMTEVEFHNQFQGHE